MDQKKDGSQLDLPMTRENATHVAFSFQQVEWESCVEGAELSKMREQVSRSSFVFGWSTEISHATFEDVGSEREERLSSRKLSVLEFCVPEFLRVIIFFWGPGLPGDWWPPLSLVRELSPMLAS